MVKDYSAYHYTCAGETHKKKNLVCQDFSACEEKENYRLVVVCDGHGGADYFRSDRGSRFAAEAFCACVDNADFLAQIEALDTFTSDIDAVIQQFIKSVIARWNSAVDRDLKGNPFTEDELQGVSEKAKKRYENSERTQSAYGTTLIGFVFSDRFCFGVQIGDGKCIVVNRQGQFSEPIPWDDNCFLNITTFISDENAFSEFRYWYGSSIFSSFPIAVFLGSDGIDDSFAGIGKLKDFYLLILKNLASSDTDEAITDLEDYLPVLSAQGSGDDMSLGILIDKTKVRQKKELWEGQGIRLWIQHDGNLGADRPNEHYYKEIMLEVNPGIYEMSKYTCRTYSTENFEILACDDEKVVLKIGGQKYEITREKPLKLESQEIRASYDGAHFTAADELTFTLL